MNSDIKNQQNYLKAHKRVENMKAFYRHLTVFLLVIPIIIFINLKFSPWYHWFWFSTLGWGFGLFFHWLAVFGFNLIGFGKNWEEKKIKEYMNSNN